MNMNNKIFKKYIDKVHLSRYNFTTCDNRTQGDEKLGSVSIGASIGHGKLTRLAVLQAKVLIRKSAAIYRHATSAVVISEVTTLTHEAWNDTMEGGALEGQPFYFACAKRSKVLSGLGDDIIEQLFYV